MNTSAPETRRRQRVVRPQYRQCVWCHACSLRRGTWLDAALTAAQLDEHSGRIVRLYYLCDRCMRDRYPAIIAAYETENA